MPCRNFSFFPRRRDFHGETLMVFRHFRCFCSTVFLSRFYLLFCGNFHRIFQRSTARNVLSDPRNNQIRLPGLGLRACSKVWETTSSMAVGFFCKGGRDPSSQGQERTQISFAEISATFLLLEKRLPFGAQKKSGFIVVCHS